uniref:Uncharacterized protein n=1 Tax=Anguilla anguilla TaxID=7936 RepID=A0A0E9TKV3_ANGAN
MLSHQQNTPETGQDDVHNPQCICLITTILLLCFPWYQNIGCITFFLSCTVGLISTRGQCALSSLNF